MKLSQSRDLDREFNILARVDFDYVFFSHFIFQFLIDWKLGFVICFDLIFIGFSQFHDSSWGFDRLTQVEWSFSFFLPF